MFPLRVFQVAAQALAQLMIFLTLTQFGQQPKQNVAVILSQWKVKKNGIF